MHQSDLGRNQGPLFVNPQDIPNGSSSQGVQYSDMFCPNCGAQNESSQHYCRMCGLGLDAISAELAAQNPSPETALFLKKKKRIERLGIYSLSISGIIALSLLLTVAVYYKLAILGPEVLFGSAIGALILFLFASILLLGYSKYSMKAERADNTFPPQVERTPTNKLLNDPPFERATVTEHSTELLHRK